MKLNDLLAQLKEIYQFDSFEDYCVNGLQVEGKSEIKNITLGVTLSKDLIYCAINRKSDAIIVHHGIFGKNLFSLKGNLKDRIKLLLENDISLIGIHLPMDENPIIGHNKILADIINITNLIKFNHGFIGFNNENLSNMQIKEKYEIYYEEILKDKFDKENIKIFGNIQNTPEKICLISGESYKYYEEAIENGTDLFICGSIVEHIPPIVEETGKSILVLGHYYSEIPGIIALSELLKNKYMLNTDLVFYKNTL